MSPISTPDQKPDASVEAGTGTPQGLSAAPADAAPAPSPKPPAEQGDPTLELVALAQLWADQFRHLATLSVAGAGGVLILMQAELIEADAKWWLPLGLFVTTAVFAMYGQMGIVDGASSGKKPALLAQLTRGMATACLGAGGGSAIAILLNT